MYTFSFIVGDIIPKSVKCIHSATKSSSSPSRGLEMQLHESRIRWQSAMLQQTGFECGDCACAWSRTSCQKYTALPPHARFPIKADQHRKNCIRHMTLQPTWVAFFSTEPDRSGRPRKPEHCAFSVKGQDLKAVSAPAISPATLNPLLYTMNPKPVTLYYEL